MSTLDEAEAFLRELAERTTTQSVSTSLVRASRALRQQVDDTDDKRSGAAGRRPESDRAAAASDCGVGAWSLIWNAMKLTLDLL